MAIIKEPLLADALTPFIINIQVYFLSKQVAKPHSRKTIAEI